MRPTRLGVAAVGLAAFALFAAGSTGNNLLYLVFAATASALAMSLISGWENVSSLSARAHAPPRAFRGEPFTASVLIENRGRLAARLVRVVGPDGASPPLDVPARGVAAVDARLRSELRGKVKLSGLVVESLYPFALLRVRRRLPPLEVLVLPRCRAAPAPRESPGAREGAALRRARDGEFHGLRPYAADDARQIQWKMTAKTGRPVVAERSVPAGGPALVRLEGTDDATVEAAASACRAAIEEGRETGLTGLAQVPLGRGQAHLDAVLRALALAGMGESARPASLGAAPAASWPADEALSRRLLLLSGAAVYLALFLIDDLSTGALLACAPLVPLSLFLQERGGPFLTTLASNALSALVLLYLGLADVGRSGAAIASVHLLEYLLLNRAFSAWSERDRAQVFLILYLAFFLISGLTISPWYFPLFLIWIAASASWLMVQAGAESLRRLRVPVARELALGAVLGLVVFLAVPRMDGLRRLNPFVASDLDRLRVSPQAAVGFTEDVTLGYFGRLRRSPARVMRVRAEGAAVAGLSAAPPPLYVRGAALDDFDGRRWSKAPMGFDFDSGRGTRRADGDRAWLEGQEGELVVPPDDAATAPGDWLIELQPFNASVVFTIGPPRRIEGLTQGAWFDHTDTFYAVEPFRGGARYRIFPGPVGWQPTDAGVDLRGRALERALAPPPDPDGRLAALAAAWTRGAADAPAKAAAIAARLRAGYSYSLSSDARDASLEGFLFKSKRGNCEYFASAAAVLLRLAGVPTRLVTGFYAEEWNAWGRFYDVRQSDAHAWVEYYADGRGWTSLDPTPPESGMSAALDELSRRLSRWMDAAQANWYRRVVGYDQYDQRDALLRLSFAATFDRARRAALDALPRALGWLFAAAVLLWISRAARSLRRAPGDDYERAERVLARAGLPRAPGDTPREYARAVAAARPELAPVAELAEEHYRTRYEGRPPDAARRARARALLRQLRARL